MSNVSLAGSGRPKGNAVLSLLDPFAPCQFQNQRLVEGGLRGEVECVEALDLRKAREANTTFGVPALDCCSCPIPPQWGTDQRHAGERIAISCKRESSTAPATKKSIANANRR